MVKVYTLSRVPGATDGVEWTSICHSKNPFVFIHHSDLRDVSRWVSVKRKRPFMVATWSNGYWAEHSAHKTLDGARKAAQSLARVMSQKDSKKSA